MPIIALAGLAGHGKTTVAKILAEELPKLKMSVEVHAFATRVKIGAAALFDVGLKNFYAGGAVDRNTYTIYPHSMTIRAMMTSYGNGIKDIYGGDFWIKHTLRGIGPISAIRPNTLVLVEDLRFGEGNPWGPAGDEEAAMRNHGVTIWHIDASERVEKTAVHDDVSEQGISVLPEDVVIYNNADEATLRAAVVTQLMQWKI
jgi:hypothetical protein